MRLASADDDDDDNVPGIFVVVLGIFNALSPHPRATPPSLNMPRLYGGGASFQLHDKRSPPHCRPHCRHTN